MTPEQCRAYRKRLRWSQEELADRATMSVSAVRQFELGRGSSRSYVPTSVQRAFAAAGLALADESADVAGATADPLPCHGGIPA